MELNSSTAEKYSQDQKARLEAALLSSSASPKRTDSHSCDMDCKKSKYSKLSTSVLAKLLEHNISPDGLDDSTALSRLTKIGVPVEDMAVAITLSGKDLSSIRSMIFKSGKGNLLKALSQGFDNLSMASVYDYIDKNQVKKAELSVII